MKIYLLLITLFFYGCTYNPNDRFTAISEKKDLSKTSMKLSMSTNRLNEIKKLYTVSMQKCEVSLGSWWVMWIPVASQADNDANLVNELLKKCGGDLATNVEIYNELYWAVMTPVWFTGKFATATIWKLK